jgi:hypothetical protein
MSITICNNLYTLDTTEVTLIGCNLSKFPMEIFKLSNLEYLYLQENKINNLPNEIGLLKKLKELNLENNEITSIPSEIGMLTNLEYLNISDNELTTIPDEIGMLHILKDLYLNNNILSDFCPSICNLSNLEILSLTDNNIISIPSNINNMRGLQELFLRDNQITHIPVELCELENLNELIIRNNQITELPLEITNLENLTLFQYYGNPIENFLHPRIHAFVERLLYVNHNVVDNNIYADSQNIHTSSIQQNTKDSIIRLLQQMEDNYEYDYITDSELSDKCKEALVEYSEDMTIHTQLNSNFKDILMAVFYEISQLTTDAMTFAKQRLNEEMLDSECKCFTGRITRLINSLSGISDKVIIKISDAEEIANVISVARTKFVNIDEIKEYVRKDLEERNYTDEVISEWIEYIE